MELQVYDDAQRLAEAAAQEMTELLRRKPDAVICMASGNSPKLTCEVFTRRVLAEGLDTSQFFFLGLDEWVGVPPETHGSCHHDFSERLFIPLGMTPDRYHLFDGMSKDLGAECTTMDAVIRDKGGIDLMIVGIGMNGHIGFNEPGCDMNALSHVAQLAEMTATVGQQYFRTAMKLEHGITIGLGHLRNARRVILIANGASKKEIVGKALSGPVSSDLPASVMQTLPQGVVMVDRAAAGR